MGLAIGPTDLEPPHGDRAAPPGGVVNGVNNGFELLFLRQELAIPPLDQIGGLRGKQSRAVFPMISARDMPIIVSAARLTKT